MSIDQSVNYTPEQQLRYKAKKLTKLLYGIFWFIIINIFLYWLDYRDNLRIDWAYWVTIGWGFGLAYEGFSYIVGPNIEEAIYNKLSKK
jgi:2TM domain